MTTKKQASAKATLMWARRARGGMLKGVCSNRAWVRSCASFYGGECVRVRITELRSKRKGRA